MRFVITICLLALTLSGCAPTAPTATSKETPSPSPSAEPDNTNLTPGQQAFNRVFDKAIKDGHVNSICQDMNGSWEVVPAAEEFKVCRPVTGFLEVGTGFVQVLRAFDYKDQEKGLLEPVIFDCAGGSTHVNINVYYGKAGKITSTTPVALGGAWEPIKPGSKMDAVRGFVCKEATAPKSHRR